MCVFKGINKIVIFLNKGNKFGKKRDNDIRIGLLEGFKDWYS